VLRSKPAHFDKAAIERGRKWLHGYIATISRDPREPQDPNAHPPDDFIVAQFLALAEWSRLEKLLRDLFHERKRPGQTYGWFVTVGLQRIHGITWLQTGNYRQPGQPARADARHPRPRAGSTQG
jgi:hypothetical protein